MKLSRESFSYLSQNCCSKRMTQENTEIPKLPPKKIDVKFPRAFLYLVLCGLVIADSRCWGSA